jgi:hypothetical protein
VIEKEAVRRSIIDRSALPVLFPTHAHTPLFWEQFGRTVATFGYLEKTLGSAIFAFGATRMYDANKIKAAYKAWEEKLLQRVLIDTLCLLADSYGKEVRENQDSNIENVDELVERIKKAATIRNVLCHGSWAVPDYEGKSLPLFVSRNEEIFETKIGIPFLRQVQDEVAALACDVIDTVTQMGWQFPGGGGPGETIWPTIDKKS